MSKIINRQFKHAFHLPKNENREDTVFVKELVVYEDGRREDVLKKLTNATRPYYITNPNNRNHEQKKEHELKSKVTEYRTTQSNLEADALRRLKGNGYIGQVNRRALNMSPYIYGTDIHIKELIKDKYDTVYSKGEKDLFTTTFFDIEYNIKKEQTCILTSMRLNPQNKNEVEIDIYVNNSTSGINIQPSDSSKIENILREEFKVKLPPKFMKDRTFRFKFYFSSDVIEVLDIFWENTHRQKSDFLTAWNVHYDITQIEKEYIKAGEDFARRVTDPSLGDEYVAYTKKIVPNKMVTAGGVNKPIPPHRRWHTFRSPATFYIIDQMATYSYLRITDKSILGGYSLDNILNKEGGLNKMSFPHLDELEGLTSIEWHNTCLAKYPIEYACYNVWDVMLCLILEWKNQDLASTLPIFINKSGFEDFDSSTKYVLNDFHFYALANDRVLGTTVVGENFGDGIGRRGWTVTLPPWPKYKARSNVMGSNIPYMADSTALLVGDTDVIAAYPNATSFANISKDTTRSELVNIEGVENYTKWKTISSNRIQKMKELNLAFFSGESSHEEYSEWMYDMPDQDEFLELAIEHFGLDYERSDYDLSKQAIENITDNLDGREVIKVDNGKRVGAYFVRPSKIDDSHDGRYNYFNIIDKHATDISWEEYEDLEMGNIKDSWDSMMSNYISEDKMKGSDSVEVYFSKPLDRLSHLEGRGTVFKTGSNPKYKSMKNINIDTSYMRGNESSYIVRGSKGIHSYKYGDKASLDAMDSYEANPLVYGGKPRAIGGSDSIDRYKKEELLRSNVKELVNSM